MIDSFFKGDSDKEQYAFEAFGQGILYDDRRGPGQKLHKMDGDPPEPLVGYVRWHAFSRAAILLGEEATRWLRMDRVIGLAWDIQLQSKIVEDNPNNPGLSPDKIIQLRKMWLSKEIDELDDAFDRGFQT